MVGGRGRRLGVEPCRALLRDAAVALRDRVRDAAEGLWVALGCVLAGVALRFAAPAYRRWIDPTVGIAALYVLSLGILDLAERTFGGSIETDFERGTWP